MTEREKTKVKFYADTKSPEVARKFGEYADFVYVRSFVKDGDKELPINEWVYRLLLADRTDGTITLYRYPGIITTIDEFRDFIIDRSFTLKRNNDIPGFDAWARFVNALTGCTPENCDEELKKAVWSDPPLPAADEFYPDRAEIEGGDNNAGSDAN